MNNGTERRAGMEMKVLLPILVTICLTAFLGLSGWMMKLDQRLYELNGNLVTKDDMATFKDEIGKDLDDIKEYIRALVEK